MKPVAHDRWTLYRDRADAYLETMKLCRGQQPFDTAVPLLATHACISLADSILVYKSGHRGAENHAEAGRELRKLCRSGSDHGVKHLDALIGNRTAWIYGDQRVGVNDVNFAYNSADRFFAWANRAFPELARGVGS